MIITIDGPAASGKSTVARKLAAKLNADFLDTGAMYRAVTYAAIKAGVELTSPYQILETMNNTQFEFTSSVGGMRVQMDGVDITEEIRNPHITASARFIAGSSSARQRLVQMQRKFAEGHGRIVAEGRDQGTVAFPHADIKFYLTADLDERAKRRLGELEAKGAGQDIERVKEAIEKRDESDRKRSDGPLKAADDAITVDTTNLTIEQVVEKLLAFVKEKCSANQ